MNNSNQRNSLLPKDGILAPIALFFIVFGIQAVILYQLVSALNVLSETGLNAFLHSSWIVAGILSTTYSMIRLRPLLKSSMPDKLIYWFFPLLFASLISFGIFNLIQ